MCDYNHTKLLQKTETLHFSSITYNELLKYIFMSINDMKIKNDRFVFVAYGL